MSVLTRVRKYQQKHAKAGLCLVCPRKAAPKRKKCRACLKKDRDAKRLLRAV